MIEIKRPTLIVDELRVRKNISEMIEKRPGQWQQTAEITIEIEGEDKPALMCEWITQYFV